MASIYRSAATVISWLGIGDEQMARAFRTIFETHKLIVCSLAGFIDLEWMESYPQLWKLDRASLLSDFWEGIEKLNKLPYWRRVWIIQEMALVKDLYIMIPESGDCLLNWDHLEHFRTLSDFMRLGRLTKPEWFSIDLRTILCWRY
jgi:hypothetical protein